MQSIDAPANYYPHARETYVASLYRDRTWDSDDNGVMPMTCACGWMDGECVRDVMDGHVPRSSAVDSYSGARRLRCELEAWSCAMEKYPEVDSLTATSESIVPSHAASAGNADTFEHNVDFIEWVREKDERARKKETDAKLKAMTELAKHVKRRAEAKQRYDEWKRDKDESWRIEHERRAEADAAYPSPSASPSQSPSQSPSPPIRSIPSASGTSTDADVASRRVAAFSQWRRAVDRRRRIARQTTAEREQREQRQQQQQQQKQSESGRAASAWRAWVAERKSMLEKQRAEQRMRRRDGRREANEEREKKRAKSEEAVQAWMMKTEQRFKQERLKRRQQKEQTEAEHHPSQRDDKLIHSSYCRLADHYRASLASHQSSAAASLRRVGRSSIVDARQQQQQQQQGRTRRTAWRRKDAADLLSYQHMYRHRQMHQHSHVTGNGTGAPGRTTSTRLKQRPHSGASPPFR